MQFWKKTAKIYKLQISIAILYYYIKIIKIFCICDHIQKKQK